MTKKLKKKQLTYTKNSNVKTIKTIQNVFWFILIKFFLKCIL